MWCCWDKESDNNKLSLPFFLCLRKRKRGQHGNTPSSSLWWCFNEKGYGSLLPSPFSLVVLKFNLVVSGCL
jgi:hypothetical protein